jgi:hypothetical protein
MQPVCALLLEGRLLFLENITQPPYMHSISNCLACTVSKKKELPRMLKCLTGGGGGRGRRVAASQFPVLGGRCCGARRICRERWWRRPPSSPSIPRASCPAPRNAGASILAESPPQRQRQSRISHGPFVLRITAHRIGTCGRFC